MIRIGFYICHCGINIAATVDSVDVAEYASTLPHVVVARDYMYMCSDPGQALVRASIQSASLDGIVVAACSPSLHEVTFRGARPMDEAESFSIARYQSTTVCSQRARKAGSTSAPMPGSSGSVIVPPSHRAPPTIGSSLSSKWPSRSA